MSLHLNVVPSRYLHSPSALFTSRFTHYHSHPEPERAVGEWRWRVKEWRERDEPREVEMIGFFVVMSVPFIYSRLTLGSYPSPLRSVTSFPPPLHFVRRVWAEWMSDVRSEWTRGITGEQRQTAGIEMSMKDRMLLGWFVPWQLMVNNSL